MIMVVAVVQLCMILLLLRMAGTGMTRSSIASGGCVGRCLEAWVTSKTSSRRHLGGLSCHGGAVKLLLLLLLLVVCTIIIIIITTIPMG